MAQPASTPEVVDKPRNDELFRLLVDSVRDYAIFVLSPDGHVLTWNLGAQALKGYSNTFPNFISPKPCKADGRAVNWHWQKKKAASPMKVGESARTEHPSGRP